MGDNPTSGAPLAVTLDGYHLDGISPSEVTVREDELVHHRQGGDATGRESRPWVEPGEPEKRIKYLLTLDYDSARKKAPLIDRLLARAGAHRVSLWKHVVTAHESDGASQVLVLPRAFVQDALSGAGDPIVPPGGHPWWRFRVVVRLADPSTESFIEPQAVDQATWDAGDPAAGVVWRLQGQPRLKLAPEDVPLPGEAVYVESVPEFRVHRVAPADTSYRSPIREPRRLELREA